MLYQIPNINQNWFNLETFGNSLKSSKISEINHEHMIRIQLDNRSLAGTQINQLNLDIYGTCYSKKCNN
jgi:hypothetical protein